MHCTLVLTGEGILTQPTNLYNHIVSIESEGHTRFWGNFEVTDFSLHNLAQWWHLSMQVA